MTEKTLRTPLLASSRTPAPGAGFKARITNDVRFYPLVKALSGDGYLLGKIRKTGHPVFAVDGIFGPEEFGVMMDEAKQRSLPTDGFYVFCQYATYTSGPVSVRLLKDLRGPYQADDTRAYRALLNQHRATLALAGRIESGDARAVALVASAAPPQDSTTAIDAFTKAVAAMSTMAASIADIAKAQTALLAMQAKPQEITVKLEQPASVVNVTLPEFPAVVVNVPETKVSITNQVPAAQVVVNHPDIITAEHVRDPETQEILRTVTTHQSATRH